MLEGAATSLPAWEDAEALEPGPARRGWPKVGAEDYDPGTWDLPLLPGGPPLHRCPSPPHACSLNCPPGEGAAAESVRR